MRYWLRLTRLVASRVAPERGLGVGLPARPAGLPAGQAGFSLIELLISIVVLIVGIVAVAKMVPTAIDLNFRNRYESTALILAQRQLDQIMTKALTVKVAVCPLGAPPANHYAFCDSDGYPVALGPSNLPAAPPGVVATDQSGCDEAGGVIDFSGPCGADGYFKTIQIGAYTYDLRWNVVTYYMGTAPTAKRVMVAARGRGPRLLPPTTLTVLTH